MVDHPGGAMQLFLAERDVPCPGCGYNLRGLESPACPECNEALELRITLAEPRQGAYIAGIIGLSIGIGFHGIMLAWAAFIMLWAGFGTASMMADVWPLPLALILEVAALAAWMRGRRRLRRMPQRGQVTLAAACWGLTAALAVLIFYHSIS